MSKFAYFLRRVRSWFLSRGRFTRRRLHWAISLDDLEPRTLLSGGASDTLLVYDQNAEIWITGETTAAGFQPTRTLGVWDPSRGWDFYPGDFDGDGRRDIVGRADDGGWQIVFNHADRGVTVPGADWGLTPDLNWEEVRVGDLNGDGRDDLVGQKPNGEWWVAHAGANQFRFQYLKRISSQGFSKHLIGDFNNDGKDDVAHFHVEGSWWVTQSGPYEFRNTYYGRIAPVSFSGWQNLQVGDFNGDGWSDVLAQDSIGRWWTGTNNQSGAFSWRSTNRWSTSGYEEYRIGDFNGDGRDDLAARTTNNHWFLNASQPDGSMILDTSWGKWASDATVFTDQGDFNADGKDDIAGWFPETGLLWVNLGRSTGSELTYFGVYNPAFEDIDDRPGLPRMLIIGDSISIGYTLPLRAELVDVANVHRVLTNAGSTTKGLGQVDSWTNGEDWDLILFNFGLHDLKYVDALGNFASPDTGFHQNSPGQYQANLELIAQRLLSTGATLVWANTTYVPQGTLGRVSGEELIYNSLAENVMDSFGIPTIDLHTLTATELRIDQLPQDVHFTDTGSRKLGEFLGDQLRPMLESRFSDPGLWGFPFFLDEDEQQVFAATGAGA
ncbi:MAG: VCBS repeat-containing protein [Planctomycetaceae bacterium]|nr:VCBS repeat-containing protein [Planctomycetaceae bacterium]